MSPWKTRSAILLLLLVVFMPLLHQSMTTASVSQGPKLSLDPAGIYVGAWQPGFPNVREIDKHERTVQKRPAIIHWYQGWGTANAQLDMTAIRNVAGRGSVPMITWEPWDYTRGVNQPEYSLARIANGDFDAYVRSWAKDLSGYEGTVLIRFAHEMNHPYYPWSIGVNGNSTQDYINAWRRVHGIFQAENAVNVQWVWSPLVWWEGAPLIEPMYPGDEYVDWIALDGYNHVPWGGWQSFDQIFGASYSRLTAMSAKPIMIAEVASSEAGGNKATWIRNTFAKFPTHYPQIRAVVWFNENKEADWRVNSSNASLKAYRSAIASSYYIGAVR